MYYVPADHQGSLQLLWDITIPASWCSANLLGRCGAQGTATAAVGLLPETPKEGRL